MTEHEIVRESKQAWELLNDLNDNCELLNKIDKESIMHCMYALARIYANAWEMMSENNEEWEQLQSCVKCPHCKNNLVKSDIISYAYVCENCDENMYYTECEVEKAWWNND